MLRWITPGQYNAFENEEQAVAFCKTWGLLSDKATKAKAFRYKGQNLDAECEIVGYADLVYAVIRIDEQLHSIHPSYLREMQSAQFGKSKVAEEGEAVEGESPEGEAIEGAVVAGEALEFARTDKEENSAAKAALKPDKQAKRTPEKPAKEAPLTLQEGKASMEASVSEFATVPNPFSGTDDEVVIFAQVSFQNDNEPITLDFAWSSYNMAMKKLELQIGDKVAFEAKVVAKKLNKHPVKYKINNAAKVSKITE